MSHILEELNGGTRKAFGNGGISTNYRTREGVVRSKKKKNK